LVRMANIPASQLGRKLNGGKPKAWQYTFTASIRPECEGFWLAKANGLFPKLPFGANNLLSAQTTQAKAEHNWSS